VREHYNHLKRQNPEQATTFVKINEDPNNHLMQEIWLKSLLNLRKQTAETKLKKAAKEKISARI